MKAFNRFCRAAAAALGLVSAAPAALAERLEKCPVDSSNAAEIADSIKAAPSCAQSYEVLNVCRSGAAADVGLAETVTAICEKVFLPTLDAAASRAYGGARDACARKFAASDKRQQAGFSAVCEAGVAVVFAHRADIAAMRAKRAPFGALAPVNRN